MQSYYAGPVRPKKGEIYRKFIVESTKTRDNHETDFPLSPDRAELIGRLMGFVFEDGTDLPIDEHDRWVRMGVLVYEGNKKCLELPDDFAHSDFDYFMLPMWFYGYVDMYYNEEKKQTEWSPGPNRPPSADS